MSYMISYTESTWNY